MLAGEAVSYSGKAEFAGSLLSDGAYGGATTI